MSQFLPGPHLTMMMADHGAEVVKVEPYDGGEPGCRIGLAEDGETIFFRNTHRGKRSLRLNLKHPSGREILLQLAERADVRMARLAGRDGRRLRPGAVPRRSHRRPEHQRARHGSGRRAETAHLGVPVRFAREPAQAQLRTPSFGEHTDEIMASLGYDRCRIEQLRQESAIG